MLKLFRNQTYLCRLWKVARETPMNDQVEAEVGPWQALTCPGYQGYNK